MASKSTLNAIMPTMMPSAKKINAIINQITPQTVAGVRIYSLSDAVMPSPRDGQQPQMSANALASEVLTLRRMVSSWRCVNEKLTDRGRIHTDDVPQDVHARHNANK